MSRSGRVPQTYTPVANPIVSASPFIRWLLLFLTIAFCAMPLLPIENSKLIRIPFYLFGAFVLFRHASVARSSYPVWLMLAVIAQMTLTWVCLLLDHPDIARSGPSLEDYLDKFAFLIIAIALAGSTKNLALLYAVLTALIFLIPWLLGDGITDFFDGLQGHREGLGLNPIRTALYLSLVVLGLLAFRGRFFKLRSIMSIGALIWLILLLACIGALLMTQTRGVLACLLLVIFAFGIHCAWAKRRIIMRNGLYSVVLVLLVTLLLVAGSQTNLVMKNYQKFAAEMSTVNTILKGDIEALPNSSWGLRAQFWVVGIKWIGERPITGWGYRAGRYVLSQEAQVHPQLKHYRQLHNSYLELTVRYGVGGLLIILSLFGWVLYRSNQAYKRGNMPEELRNFSVISIALFMLAACFYGLFFDDIFGLHIMSIVLGVPVSFIYKDLQSRSREPKVEALTRA